MLIKKFWKLYPKSKNRKEISLKRLQISKKMREKIMKFGKHYFDSKREYGYGGYYYNKKFFRKIAKEFIKHYNLNNNSKILDIGCAKGFLMNDLKHYLPKAEIKGIDISSYCKTQALKSVKKDIKVGSCDKLPFKSNYFDFVVSISTIHNLPKKRIFKAFKELLRVGKKKFFIRLKAYETKKEKKFIADWNIVAKSNLSKKEWLKLFKSVNYKGDYDFSKF